jgi:plasmid stabilization system protein ParE
MTRTLREQIDWQALRDRTRESAFARAFFTLAEELSVAPRTGPAHPEAEPAAARARVRVVES